MTVRHNSQGKQENNKRKIGSLYESMAIDYLTEKGYLILEKNYRYRHGEIDLIAMDGSYLVFIEVKYRKRTSHGHPLEAIDQRKQRQISKTAMYYLLTHRYPLNQACRFDIVAFLDEETIILKNAFEISLH